MTHSHTYIPDLHPSILYTYQIEAFTALVQEKLGPALRASQYRDERNFLQNVRATILRATRFPLGAIIAKNEKKAALEDQFYRGLTDGMGLTEVMARAQHIYKELDNWLGASTGDFFFGREPTSFDAVLFGHLAEAFADINFLVFLPSYSNLVRYFRFIAEQYFSSSSSSSAAAAASTLLSPPDKQTRDLWARADYVNSQNPFNQVEGAKICVESPLVPEPVVQKFLEGDGWDGKFSKGKKAVLTAGSAAKSKAEIDEEEEQRKQNVLWLTIVGAFAGDFFVFQGIATLLASAQEEEEEGEEAGEEGGEEVVYEEG